MIMKLFRRHLIIDFVQSKNAARWNMVTPDFMDMVIICCYRIKPRLQMLTLEFFKLTLGILKLTLGTLTLTLGTLRLTLGALKSTHGTLKLTLQTIKLGP